MAYSNVVLWVHIVASCAWLGGNVAAVTIASRLGSAGSETRAWWADTYRMMLRVSSNAGALVVLITGVLLVLDDRAEFKDTFVSIGFFAVIVGGALGGAVFIPGTRKLAAAIRAGDRSTETSVATRLNTFRIVDTVIVVFTIYAMVARLGA